MTQAPIEPHHKDDAANILSQSYDRILTIAQTLANDEAKGKALAEIDRIAKRNHWGEAANETFLKIAAIAAPYRASDPVAEAVRALEDGRVGASVESYAACLKHELAERGLEIVERKDR